MRHCYNERPEVYEASDSMLSKALARAAVGVKALEDEGDSFNVTVAFIADEYVVTVYAS